MKFWPLIMSIPPTFRVLMPLLELIQIVGHWIEKGEECLRGMCPWEAEKCIVETQFEQFGANLLATVY